MKIMFSILFALIATVALAQYKYDYTWLMGVEQDPSPDYPINCMNLLGFKNGQLSIEKLSLEYPMYLANASISDENGDLLFYSNGCDIKDKNHNIMPNGSGLNPGIIADDFCPNNGYITDGGLIILPTPRDSNKFYIFHQGTEVFNTSPYIRIDKLYYTVVDMSLNNGLGDVISKNNKILSYEDNGNTFYEYIHAVRHANNTDWWVLTLSEGGDTYYKVLLDENGVSVVDSQFIGDEMTTNGGGQIAFSPDGTKFAKYDFMDQLMLFDFDRSTGLLSNYQQMDIDTNELAFCGLAFSPNSKRLYLSTQTKLWQLDLEAPDILASKTLVGEWDGFVYEFFSLLFPVYFQRMQLGPDCRIYMTSHGPVAYMHVINDPNELGTACNFVQRGLTLPCSVNYSIPNFPNYRLGTGYPVCDSSIVYVSSGQVPTPPVPEVRVWPNPAGYELYLENNISFTRPTVLWLFNATGQAVRHWEVSAGQQVHSFMLDGLADGMYFWKLGSNGKGLGSGKLLIMN
ncbi:MAG: T9SS type A sorting domain-containing protein [Bacteroidetes bacterium]|nr:T9SS type A sorting domain-containing protein [Bacteroidota bacterium]